MNQKLKKMHEEVGAINKEIRSYLDSETRKALTGEARAKDAKLAELETRHATAAADFDAEFRQSAREGNKPVDLSRDEVRSVDRFDLGKVLNHLHRQARGANVGNIDGVEAELLQEGEREARSAGIEAGGIMLPRLLVRRGVDRRDMTASGTTSVAGDQGGMTVATTKGGLLDDFYHASIARQLGATVVEGLVGNLDLPRLTAGTAPAAKAENAPADETSPLTAMLQMSPKRLPAYIDISERLLKQSSSAIEAIVGRNLTAQMLAIQEAAIFHGGGTNEPVGVAGTAGIGSVAGGAAGLAPALLHLVNLETAVDTNNALSGSLRYCSNGQIRGKLKQTAKFASTDSVTLLQDGQINGYEALFTNAISRTLVKGGSGAVCSAIFFGNWQDLYIGYWGGMSLEMVRDKTNAIGGLYTLVASSYYDAGVARPKSFAAMLDALGA
jgi:HK97 family phage major capsid protein